MEFVRNRADRETLSRANPPFRTTLKRLNQQDVLIEPSLSGIDNRFLTASSRTTARLSLTTTRLVVSLT